MLSLAAIPFVFKSGDTLRIPENPNPAGVPCLLFSQEVKTA